MSSVLLTRKLCLVTGSVMPVMSTSWKASVPSTLLETLPVMQTIGMESSMAVAMPVTRLVAPGPLVAMRNAHLAGRARVAVGHVRRALLVADEDVVDGKLAQRIVDGQNRSARIAEDIRNALTDQRRPDNLRAGQPRGRGEVAFCGMCGLGVCIAVPIGYAPLIELVARVRMAVIPVF